ncbi:hypothetical protein C0Q70_07982 [Pomacea canaliculata]|uniref:Uncharacterized protein n=1 Tax=Pomacea canaliculata TaxID=400727 RepID=A0A2T7PGI8_POMCA|nr:hypothetical protein C0Q70_07982 [Pomacea canaliculata]
MQEPSTEGEPLTHRALQHPGLSSSTPSLCVTSDSHPVNGIPTERRSSSCACMPPSPTAVTLDDKRRVSINSCIRTMRENSSNYDNQLLGCQNTVKVVLAKADAISCVLNAMRLFPEREELPASGVLVTAENGGCVRGQLHAHLPQWRSVGLGSHSASL